ncbi:MAG: hypothetical protein ACTSVY_08975 [Candidatus Helarchaeota archaeon]
MKKSAILLENVLRDIRNERTPEWSNSDYFVGTVIAAWSINLMYKPSNYESLRETYNGWASKEIYGLPDYTFNIHPYRSFFLGQIWTSSRCHGEVNIEKPRTTRSQVLAWSYRVL